MKVIRAIWAGQRDPRQLLALCDVQIRKNKAGRVTESLRGTWQPEHLFALRQALELWDFYQQKMRERDQAIEQALQAMSSPGDGAEGGSHDTRGKSGGSHTPRIARLHKMLIDLCGGIDPTRVPDMADHSLPRVISQTGVDLTKWRTEKHFTSSTGLAPGTAQSGKRRRNQARPLNNVGRMFRDMALGAGQTVDSAFGGFYRRLNARRGGLVATKALARKPAVMFWQAMVHGSQYVEQGIKRYQERAALSKQRVLAKLAHKHGMQLARMLAPA